ncbi:conserved hypothetical protein [Tenacibaculum sp. 190524A02b]|uniref:Oxidase n=1 Tax=Tenacibaculum vairaonense TaxID=3137860 RepID=A0ABM9PR04_9FLAO
MNDILLDEYGDLLIKNGDLVIGDATFQHQDAILMAQKGEYKQHPEIGVGIENALQDENPHKIISEIRQQLKHIGMEIKSLDIDSDGNLIIDAPYKQV